MQEVQGSLSITMIMISWCSTLMRSIDDRNKFEDLYDDDDCGTEEACWKRQEKMEIIVMIDLR